MKIKIKQHLTGASEANLAAASHAILILDSAVTGDKWPVLPAAKSIQAGLKRWPKDAIKKGILTLNLPNRSQTRLVLTQLGEDTSPFALLGLARRLIAAQSEQNPRRLLVMMPGLPDKICNRMAEALVAAANAIAPLPSFKKTPKPVPRLDSLYIYDLPALQNFARTQATATGNNLARELTSLPPNELTPAAYLKRIKLLTREYGWKLEFLDMPTLKKRKAGAFIAVAQGSPNADAGIVHLRYNPAKKSSQAACALIGKGICFDTGGMNLKPAQYMHGMHEDMEGSAVALGTLLALTELKVSFPVDCWLALAQNHIGPNAYKQNDVVVASNGVSIEIMHTDAEGRMVLADTLSFAAKKKPALMIDYATLTGSCVAALGTNYSGAFTNRDALINDIIDAGRNSGERVWPFPIDEDYEKDLESDVADIKQCTISSGPDHILATRFLKRFVDDTPWIHIDLSAGNHKGGLAHIPTDVTGFGVRYTLELLLGRGILKDKKKLS